MPVNFNYIRNRIAEHSADDLLEASYHVMNNHKGKPFPVWHVFLLMKWALVYGGKSITRKKLTADRYNTIYNAIANFNQEHITNFMKDGSIDKAFQILYNQQFYLQKTVHKEVFYTQYKLFYSQKTDYDIQKSFEEKTGISVFDFLYIVWLFWLYINIGELGRDNIKFNGIVDAEFLMMLGEIVDKDKIIKFLDLLTLHPFNASHSIDSYKHKMRSEELQTMEMSFFTMFPFQLFKGDVRLVHETVFGHCVNHYIYDFLKSNDEKFTTEFGHRLEKFFELGLKELSLTYLTEKMVKQKLPAKSKLVDFVLPEDHIYIECKATELQAYPYVNPTDELLFSSLKTSIFKAYFEQIVSVSKQLSPTAENWGIIITYKEFYWSQFSSLYEIGAKNYDIGDNSHIPPENVFIIDIYTWNIIVQIVKDGKSTLLNILKLAKENNKHAISKKLLFRMHLDQYFDNLKFDLDYFRDMEPLFKIKKLGERS